MSDSKSNSEVRRKEREIVRCEDGVFETMSDFLATEEPSITMRTPGNDRELAAGFLLGEGIVTTSNQIINFENTGTKDDNGQTNQLCVHLAEDVAFDFGSLQRNFYTTSSCGICGKASLEAVRAQLSDSVSGKSMTVGAAVVNSLPSKLREHQETFEETGGLHAAGLFDSSGTLISCLEDVGRHNAMDKLIGEQLLAGQLRSENERILLVSGRASFELVQKAVSANIPMLVAVGAPSSLAVELADEFGVTLVGFASKKRFNVYSHCWRIVGGQLGEERESGIVDGC